MPTPPTARALRRVSARSNAAWYPALLVLGIGGPVFAFVSGTIVLAAASTLAVILLLVARAATPAAALIVAVVIYVLVPFDYLVLPKPLEVVSPIAILLGLAAAATGAPPPPWLRGVWLVPPFAFAAYAAVLPLLQPHGQLQTVLSWTVVVISTVIAVPLWMTDATIFQPVATALTIIVVALAASAVIEFTTRSNIYAPIYESAPYPLSQVWSVYRTMTSLGHPLVNGTFFASVGSLAFGLFLKGRHLFALVAFAASAVGVLLSGSRGGLIALGAGILFAAILTALRLTTNRTLRLALTVVPLVVILVAIGPQNLDTRSNTEEGAVSAEVRTTIFQIGMRVIRTTAGVLGSGGGLSGTVLRENGGGEYVLESSLWQIVFSYGAVGAVLLFGYITVILVRSIARGAVAGPAMIVAYAVAASSFNLFESAPAALIMPALALLLTVSEARASAEPQVVSSSSPLRHSPRRSRPELLTGQCAVTPRRPGRHAQ